MGDIVHNGQEVARLEGLGLQTIDNADLRSLPPHSRVLLRAHGQPPSTDWLTEQRGIEVIDATCPVVKKLQNRIHACYEQHKNDEAVPPQIVIYGKRGHAEVIGLQGQTNNTAIVIEREEELDQLDFSRPIYLFSQTTKSVEGFQSLVKAIQQKQNLCSVSEAVCTPSAKRSFEYHDTICRSVANRVAQLQAFAKARDLVIFVGGGKSSNAKVLYQHGVEANPKTIFVSSPDELENKLAEYREQIQTNPDCQVGICGATSTPLWLMEKVRDQLTDFYQS